MRVQILTVTPVMANRWLEQNTMNRPLSRTLVEKYIREMQAGTFVLNGETIKLNGTTLLDGQHRLHACVESGCAFDSLVAFDVPTSTFDTIDTGRSRNAGDILGMAGHVNGRNLAALVRLVCGVKANRFVISSVQMPPHEIRAWVSAHPNCVSALARGMQFYAENRSVGPSVWGAACYLLGDIDPVASDAFLDQVARGIGVEEKSWVYTLRRSLFNAGAGKGGGRAGIAGLAKICKAWNGMRQGTKAPARVSWMGVGERREDFPLPI